MATTTATTTAQPDQKAPPPNPRPRLHGGEWLTWSFENRTQAGRLLAQALGPQPADTVTLGLARGGMPVAAQVASLLRTPLDLCAVRKIGAPLNPELALGAVASGGIRHFNRDLAGSLGITEPELEAAAQSKEEDLHRLEARCRNPRPESPPQEGITLTAMSKAMSTAMSTAASTEFPPTIPPVQLTGRAVLLVDDGAATGATLIAAAASVRARGARRITLAVPAAPAQVLKALRSHADAVVVLATPEPFLGVGACYREFPQVNDREVADLLLQRTGADREDTGAGTGGRGKP